MKVVALINLLFYAILAGSFISNGSSFDLGRHGLVFSMSTVGAGALYYFVLAMYLFIHSRKGRVLVDPYNIFLLLFSLLIVPGILATAPINGSYAPHFAMVASGTIFILTGILFEVLIPSLTSTCFSVSFYNYPSRNSVLIYLIIYLVLVGSAILSGNMNRAGTFDVIFELLNPSSSIELGAVADYRAEIYNTWGIRQVIGNYAGSVFGTFFSLILFSYMYVKGKSKASFIYILVSIAVISFPIIFAIGSGSRLILLRTLLIYFVFALLPYGVRLFDRRFFQIAALVFGLLVISTSILGRGVQGDSFSENLVIQTEKSIARLFLGKGGSTMVVYEYYPAIEPFEGGTPIIERFLGVNIDGQPSVAAKIFSYLTGGLLGTAGPQSFGDLYASFGYPGQLLLSPFLAFILLLLRISYIKRSDKSVLDRALWAFIAVSLGYAGYSDIASFKVIGLVYVYFIYLMLKFLATSTSRELRFR